jgi:hypothetical protein
MLNPAKVQMRMWLIIPLFLFTCLNTYSQELLPSDSLTAVLTSKESEMFSIITNGNKEAAEKLIGQDYITINADGVMEGKENTLKTIGKFKGSTASLSDKKIRVYRNVAIINGKAKFYLKQILVAQIFYTEIWNYRNEQWQFIGWQGTMTGLPSYYPVITTIIIILLLYLIIRLIIRKRKAGKLKTNQ